MPKKINIGVIGAVRRGGSFKAAVDIIKNIRVHAVCDINEEQLEEKRISFGAEEKYADYKEMIKKADIQAVIVATPMHLHVPQAAAALEKGLHVLSEVPAGISLAECKRLVKAANKSKGIYMMAENFIYMRPNAVIKEMARKGLFGELYYAEGEYLHELKKLNEITKWRRKWQTGVNGITYGTHSLGPILQWMSGDRVVSVSCLGSGHHYKDPRGEYYENEDTCVMLCKMEKGGLVKIRIDMLSDRPHAMTNYSLQGTDGCYESARSNGEKGKIWLRKKSKGSMVKGKIAYQWTELNKLEKEFLPPYWKKYMEAGKKAGHGGGDLFEMFDFLNAIEGRKPCPIGIHEAMDMTLPGIVSQKSIEKGGKWLPVPDSRNW